MGLPQIKIFCTAEETIYKIKRLPIEWENIFANTSNKVLIPKLIKKLCLNTEKRTIQFKKWAKYLNRHFSKEDILMANKHEKILNITDQEMQITLQWDTISHLSEWLPSINQQATSAGEDGEKGEPFCTVDGSADLCTHSGKQCEDTSKIKNKTAFWPSDPTSGNLFQETQNINSKQCKNLCVHYRVIQSPRVV